MQRACQRLVPAGKRRLAYAGIGALACIAGLGAIQVSGLHAEILPASRAALPDVASFLDFPQTGTGLQMGTPAEAPQMQTGDVASLDAVADPIAAMVEPSALTARAATPDEIAALRTGAFDAGPAAQPFSMRGLTAQSQFRALLCLTTAIYYEAATEPDDGQRAVAQVILNRVRHPSYPHSVCDVVYQGSEKPTGCQFTFACDGSMARVPMRDAWARARRHALEALNGAVYAPVGLATHYHTLQVSPYWGPTLRKATIVGAHIFYRWPGQAGTPAAFYARYTGWEPTPGPHPRLITPTPGGATPFSDPLFAGGAFPALPAPKGVAIASALPGPGPTALGLPAQWAAPAQQAVAADTRYVPGALPESQIRDEYRDSGQWIGK